MELRDFTAKFSETDEMRQKAVFNMLFIAGNKLQTLFDERIPQVTLKQFMLLSLVRQSEEKLTLTHIGRLLGCSRQNVKKLAQALEKKGFVSLEPLPKNSRAICICPSEKLENYFENEFSEYQKQLGVLFGVYTQDETEELFRLISKLFDGIDRLAEIPNAGGLQ